MSQNEMEQVKPAKFRLNSSAFFLTYPQCPAPKQVCADMLATKATIVKGLIGQEKHQDGNHHLHAYVRYERKLNIGSPSYFDIQWEGKTYHGKYEGARSASGSFSYITKDDLDPLELGDMDWKQETKAKESRKKILGKRLCSGEPIKQLIAEGHTDLAFGYTRLKGDIQQYLID